MQNIKLLIFIFILTNKTIAEMYSKNLFLDVLNSSLVTSQCRKKFQNFIDGFENSLWTKQMLNSYSQLPINTNNLQFEDLGNFENCVNLKTAKYCLGTIIKNNKIFKEDDTHLVPPVWAICIPSDCTTKDATEIGTTILGKLISTNIKVNFTDQLCQTNQDANPPITIAAVLTICFLWLLLLTIVACTLKDVYFGTTSLVVQAFSLYSNGKKLFKIETNEPDELPCLKGIRFFSMLWIVAYHQYQIPFVGAITNVDYAVKFKKKIISMFIISGALSTDSFFVAAGTLSAYNYFLARHKNSTFNLVWYYLQRYLRLTSSVFLVVLVSGTLLPYFGSGPRWPLMTTQFHQVCKTNWWSALLYIQNYVNPKEMCASQTYYTNIDFQLFLISAIPFFLLWKYRKIGLGLLVVLTLISVIVSFLVIWNNNLEALVFNYLTIGDHFTKYYYQTHTRASSWLIGAILGYYIFQFKHKSSFKIRTCYVIICWIFFIILLLACIFVGHDIVASKKYDLWSNCIYAILVRPLWSLGISWIILACSNNYGGPVNFLLSHPIYKVLDRFNHGIYLIHSPLLYFVVYSGYSPEYYSNFHWIYQFWGTLFFSVGLTTIMIFAMDSPVMVLETVLYEKFFKTNKVV